MTARTICTSSRRLFAQRRRSVFMIFLSFPYRGFVAFCRLPTLCYSALNIQRPVANALSPKAFSSLYQPQFSTLLCCYCSTNDSSLTILRHLPDLMAGKGYRPPQLVILTPLSTFRFGLTFLTAFFFWSLVDFSCQTPPLQCELFQKQLAWP